ncbi:MAG: dihydropyrimidinase [Chlorobi bacterium]|nr:dihydropyrimidinase [Chlorobiota bacterium]
MKLLIKNGHIINEDESFQADILCEGGKITQISKHIDQQLIDCDFIDARGKYLLPGGIDPHVHFHLPTKAGFSSDDFLSGSKAALFSGTTSIIDFVTPKKGQKLPDALKERLIEAKSCRCNYSFHISPIEWRDSLKEEISYCINKGYRTFKVYMAYKDSIGLDDSSLKKVMKVVAAEGGTITVHCEMGDEIEALRNKFISENKTSVEYHPLSRPNDTESRAVKKALELAKEASCPIYIVHVSTKESLRYIKQAKKLGQEVYAETCPQYLLLNDTKYIGDFYDTAKYVMSPPLRKEDDNLALWEALGDGTIDTMGTDHCPFSQSQKNNGHNDFRKIPNGAGGVEHRLKLLYTYGVLTSKITINQFVALTSTNAARIFGMLPDKGIIKVGADADITIWNPEANSTISGKNHFSRCDLEIYEGYTVKGNADFTILGGELKKSP